MERKVMERVGVEGELNFILLRVWRGENDKFDERV